MNKTRILLIIFLLSCTIMPGQDLVRVKKFGRNKGHLKMYMHKPAGIDPKTPAPLVVVLHGCLQCAGSVSAQTGWNTLADQHGFYVLYPQQRATNNPMKCFKWYKRRNIYKGRGENLSIINMIGYMKTNYKIDSSKVFITGLSAGAAMSVIMMADYPATFNTGAIFAGAPYKVATSAIPATMAFFGWRIKSAEKWGRYVRSQNPDFKGEYPRMIIYQGNSDKIVNKRNANELLKQWSNVQQINSSPSVSIPSFLQNKNIEKNIYSNQQGRELILFYKVDKLGHALLIDPGKCSSQGGRRGFFTRDKDFNSTLWTAYDFGLIKMPVINGPGAVTKNSTATFYVSPSSVDCRYEWNIPQGWQFSSEKNGSSITVTIGEQPGSVDVKEISKDNCIKQFHTKVVSVQ
jgi:feruloyl esterase